MNNKNIAEFLRFNWENDDEYKYRFGIFNIADEIQNILEDATKIAEQQFPNYKVIINRLEKILEELKLKVPDIYITTNNYLIESINYYIKGYTIVDNCIKKGKNFMNPSTFKLDYDHNIMFKASELISVGSSFAFIVRIKNIELFEEKQTKYISNLGDEINGN